MAVKSVLMIAFALIGTVVVTILLAILSFIQTFLQSLFLFLGLAGSNILSMILFPLQIMTFPLWMFLYLVFDTAVVVYALYLGWWSWSVRVSEVHIVDKRA